MVEESQSSDAKREEDPDLAVVVEHVRCEVCGGGYTCVGAVKLALDKGWMRDGTAWVCFECFKERR